MLRSLTLNVAHQHQCFESYFLCSHQPHHWPLCHACGQLLGYWSEECVHEMEGEYLHAPLVMHIVDDAQVV